MSDQGYSGKDEGGLNEGGEAVRREACCAPGCCATESERGVEKAQGRLCCAPSSQPCC